FQAEMCYETSRVRYFRSAIPCRVTESHRGDVYPQSMAKARLLSIDIGERPIGRKLRQTPALAFPFDMTTNILGL
ncbi:hypothetical protein C6P41_003815, partial [Kluyveromyces marxianus]